MIYKPEWLTRDGKFRTPKGSYSMPLYSCARSEDYNNIADYSAWANQQSKDAETDVSGVAGGGYSLGLTPCPAGRGLSSPAPLMAQHRVCARRYGLFSAKVSFAYSGSYGSKDAKNTARESNLYKFESRSYCNKYITRLASHLLPPFDAPPTLRRATFPPSRVQVLLCVAAWRA